MCIHPTCQIINVIEERHVDEEVENEGCEGDNDGFDDLHMYAVSSSSNAGLT